MKFSKKLASAAAIGAIAALTFGGTAATAAEGDPITLTPQLTLGAESFTVTGADCINPGGTPGEFAAVLATDDVENPVVQTGVANADGTWSATIESPAESGVYDVAAYCNLYEDQFAYASSELLVSAAAGVQLDVTVADHFETFGFTGAGFGLEENVRVEFRQNGAVVESLGTVASNEVGEIAGDITLGNTLAYGAYDVVFVGETSGVELAAALTVTDGTAAPADPGNVGGGVTPPAQPVGNAPTGAKLANTGGENFAPFAIAGGVAALALGAGAVALGRRKARTAE